MKNVNVRTESELMLDEYNHAIKEYLSIDYFELQTKIELTRRKIRPLQKQLIYMDAALRLREI